MHAARELGIAVGGTPLGCPVDVPPRLVPLAQYLLGFKYSGQGGYTWIWPEETSRFLLRMLEVTGHRLTQSDLYVLSPLRLGGTEFDFAMDHLETWGSFSISRPGGRRASHASVTSSEAACARYAWPMSTSPHASSSWSSSGSTARPLGSSRRPGTRVRKANAGSASVRASGTACWRTPVPRSRPQTRPPRWDPLCSTQSAPARRRRVRRAE